MLKTANDLSISVVKKNEDMIREAISHALDTEDWTVKEVLDRCRMIIPAKKNVEVFTFDGEPMICFYPVVFEDVSDGQSYQLKASQNFKVLYK